MAQHRYFVAFVSLSEHGLLGLGSTELETDKPISSREQLGELLSERLKSQGVRGVTVTPLSFQLFE